jgi:hypothetical protein
LMMCQMSQSVSQLIESIPGWMEVRSNNNQKLYRKKNLKERTWMVSVKRSKLFFSFFCICLSVF